MAKHVFTPFLTSNLGTDELVFRTLSEDLNNSPVPVDVDIVSVIQPGDFVYALTKNAAVATGNRPSAPTLGSTLVDDNDIVIRDSEGNVLTYDGSQLSNFKQVGYSIADSEMAKVLSITESGDQVTIKIDKILKTDLYGSYDHPSDFDVIGFENDINKINEAKIGFDREPPQKVLIDIGLKDTATSKVLIDGGQNLLTTEGEVFFDSALRSGNSTSISVSNDTNQQQSGGPVTIAEQFPTESAVSSSLLGVPRAETQLSLFSDVSTLGMDEDNWEVTVFQKSKIRNDDWENRASEEGGSRYVGKMQENIREQALELTSNLCPYSYPWPNLSQTRYREDEWEKFRRFIILGNLLYKHYEFTPFADRFLDPSKCNLVDIEVRRASGLLDRVEIINYGSGLDATEVFRYIDIWTVTWQRINRDSFTGTSKNVINNSILQTGSASIVSLLDFMEDYFATKFPGNTRELRDKRQLSLRIYENELQSFLGDFTFANTQPGYTENNDPQEVILQTKETYRYQPGRISGFTFGTRCNIDPRMTENKAEWGVANDTDQYIFQLAGPTLSIIRRSTVPLTQGSIDKSTKSPIAQQYINGPDWLETRDAEIDLITGKSKTPYYELKVPQYSWNIDGLDGSGPSGYTVDIKNVTMWKIEFSWYGAIGALFYAYIPVGNGEARWVKVHRIVIENLLTRANLQDPYFKMRYNLQINNRSESIEPQYVYKYGSSVYIDGGDEGTKKLFNFSSDIRTVPQDVDTNPNTATQQNRLEPVLGIYPKRFLKNSDGVEIPSRVIAYPESISVDASELIELDFKECSAGVGYGFTYDDGLMWARDASPAFNPNAETVSAASGGVNNNILHNVTGANDLGDTPEGSSFLSTSVQRFGEKVRDDSPNAGRTIDFCFDFENYQDATVAWKLRLLKATAHTADSEGKFIPTEFDYLTAADDGIDSPFITRHDHHAKLINPGFNGYYIDYEDTLRDSTITPVTGSETVDPPTACYETFRVRRIGDTNRSGAEEAFSLDPIIGASEYGNSEDKTTTQYRKLPINENYPIILSSSSTGQPTYRSEPWHLIPNSPYYSMNSPHGGAYGTTYQTKLMGKDFTDRHDTAFTAQSSDIAKEFVTDDISGTEVSNPRFPFNTVTNGLTTKTFCDKSVAREHTNGVKVPFSSLFGRTKIGRANDAVCSSADGLTGKEITMRFLNPHAGYRADGQNRNIHNGTTSKTIWPEFSIGFSIYPPHANFAKHGTFDKNGTESRLVDGDFISTDYTHREINVDIEFAVEGYYAETMWQNAGRFREDYRIKAIPSENRFDGTAQNDGGRKGLGSQSSTAKNGAPAITTSIGGWPSNIKLSIDEKVEYDVLSGGLYANIGAFRTDIADNISSGQYVRFPNFPNVDGRYASFGDDDADVTQIGMLPSQSGDGFIVIKDSTFDNLLATESIKFKGGEVIDDGGTSRGLIASEPVKFDYYEATGGLTNLVYRNNNPGSYNASAYLLRVNFDPSSFTLTKLQVTYVRLSYPDGINGAGTETVRGILSNAAAKTFYPYVRLKRGSQLNSINYLQKNENSQVVISPEWQVFGAALIHQPLMSTDPKKANSLVSGGTADKLGAENFNSVARLSGLSVANKIAKPLRLAISDPQFTSLSEEALNGYFPGGIRLYDDRNKLVERAKKIASYYVGADTGFSSRVPTSSKGKTASLPLQTIFGEDRTKIIPDGFGTKVLFLSAQKVNLDDGSPSATAKVKVSMNVSEI